MRIASLAILLLALTACTPVAGPAPSSPTPVALAADPAACKAAGGGIRPVCRMQQAACVIAYKDAGKACTDSDQCQGRCVTGDEGDAPVAGSATIGLCEADSDPCGCSTEVIGGKAASTLCID